MANIYDRIFKENFEPIIRFLAGKVFSLKLDRLEEIKDKIQVTIEGEADFLKKVRHDNPKDDYILHNRISSKPPPQHAGADAGV